ncbi:Rhamnogalacturonan acetylesterase [Erysiphe neolycopersici]|uniref:Rhamnogalacturonan acetylesterase n=1 Tax=Erysiphe neolycopersici TaxID=212602 RepID=A0A420HKJ7_9PEZI|nr:Rhamnogalacturonan acetylesterase [Erysiphe neolycopersici]
MLLPNLLYISAVIRGVYTQTVYLCGDSTTADNGGKRLTQGWGVFLQDSLDIKVVNNAIGGRSARSFTEEGRFKEVADLVQPGDFVVMEFGKNDGGSLRNSKNQRTPCPGDGNEKCVSPVNGQTVYTFPQYLIVAGRSMTDKGAKVIYASLIPNNPWEVEPFSYVPGRFSAYASLAAKTIGSPSATFVDHGKYVAEAYRLAGKAVVDTYYPTDHTHPSKAGALVVEKAFVRSIVCAKNELAEHVKIPADELQGECLE